MQIPRFPRLEQLFNCRLDELTAGKLEKLIRGGAPLREDTDLDFKSANYGNDDAGKRSVATDIAAFANGQGGIVIIGVTETKGLATALSPIELSDTDELRIKQIAAGLIAPVPRFEFSRLHTDTGAHGLLIIAIPPSTNAPHAVRINDTLKYCKRDGSRNRILSEGEVADEYRHRLNRTRNTELQLGSIETSATSRLTPSDDALILSLTLVPTSAGEFQIDHQTLRKRSNGRNDQHIADSPFRYRYYSVGAGRLVVRSSYVPKDSAFPYAELFKTGAGFIASDVHYRSSRSQPLDNFRRIESQHTILTTSGFLSALQQHATTNAHCMGEALLRFTLHIPAQTETHLGYDVGFGWEEYRDGMPATQTFTSEHTLNLEALSDTTEHLIAVRILLTEFFQSFGLPEVPHIDRHGALRMKYWRQGTWDNWSRFSTAKQSTTGLGETEE